MTEDIKISRVVLLMQQRKFSEAKIILSDLLGADANNIYLLSLMAEVHLQEENYDVANTLIDNAISLAPDAAHLYYIKGRICIQQNKLNEAEALFQNAIEINPQDADYFAILANVKLVRKQYNDALELADSALEIDAENLTALNVRSTSLIKLNRNEESFNTIKGALREDPNNAYTHTNYGWGLLENGEHKKALHHFKEALSNDPNYEYAHAGMLETLKATNPVYRLFLKYSFWMSNLTAKFQWGVIIGFYIGFRALGALADNNESLQPYLNPLIIALALIAFSTWIIMPISNLFLRFNKYGQFLLDRKQKLSSNYVAVSLCVFVIGLFLHFALSDEIKLTIAVYGFAMMLPLGTMFAPSRNKYALLIYTIALGITGIIAIALAFATNEMFNFMTLLFIVGFVAFQWVANYLLIKEDNV